MGPTNPQARIVEIDILRGIAVLGMILWDFRSRSMGNYYSADIIDHIVSRVITVLDIDNTIHLLFSFLFGMGLAMQMRSYVTGIAFEALPIRRLSALFIIGMVNCIFIDRTDFLYIYALYGAVLLLFVNLGTKIILASTVLLIGAPAFGRLILTRFISPESYSYPAAYDSLKAQSILFSHYSDLVLLRAQEWLREYAHPHPYIHNLDILAMFLFGLYAVRRNLFQDIPRKIGFMRKIMWFSLTVHLAGLGWILVLQQPYVSGTAGSEYVRTIYCLLSLNGRPEVIQMLIRPYTIQALALFYICFIVLLMQSNMLRQLSLPLANVGRLALSNYLLHCLIGTTLFFGYGLALYGRLGIARGEALAILVCGFQMAISSWWLRKFQFGPVEWLWRSITYWKPQPFRVPIT